MQLSWNILLIIVSISVAMIGSFTALTHAQRMRTSVGKPALLWMVAAGVTLGIVAWSMQLIGMLSWQPAGQSAVPISYDLSSILLAAVLPIASSILAFYVLLEPGITTQRIVLSSLLISVGISAMHYSGIGTFGMPAPESTSAMLLAISPDPLTLAVSVAIAVASACGALTLVYHFERIELPTLPRFITAAAILGVAIYAMHYTAMLGAGFASGNNWQPGNTDILPGISPEIPPDIALASRNESDILTMLIIISTLIWLLGGILAGWFDQRLARKNARSLAELKEDHLEFQARTAEQAAEITQSLRESEEQLRMTLRCAPDAVLICQDDGRIVYANHNFIDILQYDRGELYAMTANELVSGDWRERYRQEFNKILSDSKRHVFETLLVKKSGGKTPMELNAVLLPNGRIYVSCRDISERKQAEHKIHQLAFYDALTSLPNRRLLMDRLHQALNISARSGQFGAVMFLDLDHFKIINDTKGHDVGDMLLLEVANRLEFCLRDGDTVARLGGDEFVVVLSLSSDNTEAANQSELVAEKIRTALNQPYQLENYTHHITPSIGIVLFKGLQQSVEDLLKHADAAMYQAKTAGRNATRFYDPAMQAAIEARVDLGEELHRALEKQQFRLHFQIQVDSMRYPVGAEVLLRWEHPQRGLVLPEHFIPLAEELGLIVPIGLWVLETACAQLKTWQQHALTSDLMLAVNVSAKQFHQVDFISQVQRVVLESGARGSQLKLELTESTALENIEDAITKMKELKPLGLGFAMDDFGTGHSSLQYLKRLPLDQIKIDQSFVRDITTDPNDAAIVQTIIAMTEALGLDVIAEGVETAAQHEFLDLHGCRSFQGFLFGRPVPIEQFETLLGVLDGAGGNNIRVMA